MLKISVMVSGGGTNFQSVIDAVASGQIPDSKIVQLISSSEKAFALERAAKAGIPSFVMSHKEPEKIIERLQSEGTDLIVLAGYMKVLDSSIIQAYRNRIINIHPSLIPKYCGKGFYGIKVHEAVIAGGETESGATVHFVDEGVDTGEIIVQERVKVLPGDTPEDLAARVLEVEHKILVSAIADIAEKHGKER